MSIISGIVQIGSNVLPFPNWTADQENTDWFMRLSPGLGTLTGALTRQLQTTGIATIDLPNGKDIVIYQEGKCCAPSLDEVRVSLAEVSQDEWDTITICGEKVGKWGDGEFLKRLIELFIQLAPIIIPLILEPGPEVTPAVI